MRHVRHSLGAQVWSAVGLNIIHRHYTTSITDADPNDGGGGAMDPYTHSDPSMGRRYARSVSDPDVFEPASLSEPVPDAEAPARAESPESSTVDSVLRLAQQHPELDWSDSEGALETLAILNDPEAMADLEEAEHDIATGNLLPMDRYAPPG